MKHLIFISAKFHDVTFRIHCFLFTGPNNDHEIDLHSIASEEDYHELRSNGIYAKHNGHYTGENRHYNTSENRHYASDSGHYTSENDHYVRENEHYPNENGHFDLPLMNGDNQNGNDNIDNSYSTILSSRPMSISESIQEPLDPDEVNFTVGNVL